MSVSHQALAACTDVARPVGVTFVCTDDSEIDANWTNTAGTATTNVVVSLSGTGGEVEIEDSSTLTGTISIAAGNARAIYGVNVLTNGSEWEVENEGEININHNGVGALAGIRGNGPEAFTVTNEGKINVTRDAGSFVMDAAHNTPTLLQASANVLAYANVGNFAGIFAGENVEEFVVNNEEGASITVTGPLAAGIYSRNGGAVVINNEGTIEYVPNAGQPAGGVAISHNNAGEWEDEDGDGTTTLVQGVITINNEGHIIGDIQVVDASEGTAIRYLGARLPGIGYDPLLIEGLRSDSIINNSGDIVGNLYLGAGNHVFSNQAGGEVGTLLKPTDLVVDMRRNYDYTPPIADAEYAYVVAGSGEEDDEGEEEEGEIFSSLNDFLDEHPDHNFTFENAGSFIGNVKVVTGTLTAGSRYAVEIAPHITGSGAGSTEDNPSENIGLIDGTLAIGSGSFDTVTGTYNVTASTIGQAGPGGADATVRPVIDSVVHDGEWFMVARTLFGFCAPRSTRTASSSTGTSRRISTTHCHRR